MTIPTIPPPADRFRVGDLWDSPRGKCWRVEKLHHQKGAFMRAAHNRNTTQWRNDFATGTDMTNAWERIEWGGQP